MHVLLPLIWFFVVFHVVQDQLKEDGFLGDGAERVVEAEHVVSLLSFNTGEEAGVKNKLASLAIIVSPKSPLRLTCALHLTCGSHYRVLGQKGTRWRNLHPDLHHPIPVESRRQWWTLKEFRAYNRWHFLQCWLKGYFLLWFQPLSTDLDKMLCSQSLRTRSLCCCFTTKFYVFSNADATKDENKNFEVSRTKRTKATPQSRRKTEVDVYTVLCVRQEEQVSYDNSGCEQSMQIFCQWAFWML